VRSCKRDQGDNFIPYKTLYDISTTYSDRYNQYSSINTHKYHKISYKVPKLIILKMNLSVRKNVMSPTSIY